MSVEKFSFKERALITLSGESKTPVKVLLVFFDVLTRYLFNFTLIWMVELEIYLFALIFLLASGYAFKHEQHVRVDVFYAKKSKKGKKNIHLW